jgi:hypothetical protein
MSKTSLTRQTLLLPRSPRSSGPRDPEWGQVAIGIGAATAAIPTNSRITPALKISYVGVAQSLQFCAVLSPKFSLLRQLFLNCRKLSQTVARGLVWRLRQLVSPLLGETTVATHRDGVFKGCDSYFELSQNIGAFLGFQALRQLFWTGAL